MQRLLTPADLAFTIGLSVQTIYIRVSEGRSLPSHIKLGRRALRFPEQDVADWIASMSQGVVLPVSIPEQTPLVKKEGVQPKLNKLRIEKLFKVSIITL